MRSGPDVAFDAFVEREHEALLRLARLLEEDPGDADALVRATLARVRRRWRTHGPRGDAVAAARASVVRRVLTRRPSAGPRTSGWVDEFEAAWDADGSEELRRALFDLPVRTRAATVLTLWARLPVEEVAGLLREDPDAVRAEVAAGTARLGSALALVPVAWPAGPLAGGPPVEEELRRGLAALAGEGGPAGPAAAVADTARRDARAVRRRWLLGAAAVCTAAAVAVPGTLRPQPADQPAAGAATGAATGAAATTERSPRRPAPPLDVTRLPTRGSLAGDEAFLTALRDLPWEGREEWGVPVEHLPRPEDRRVLFAGEVPGGRWALLAGPPAQDGSGPGGPVEDPVFGDETVIAWFTGPPGARPAQMRMSSSPYPLSRGVLPSLLDPRTGTLVVLAAPGDVLQVSRRPVVDADGSRYRVWEHFPSQDGVVVAPLGPTGLPVLWSVSFRVPRQDVSATTTTTGTPDVLLPGGLPELPALAVRYPRGRPPAGERRAAEDAAGQVLTQLGLPPGEVEISALVTGPVPAPATGEVALVSVRVPSGATVLTGSWSQQLPDGSTAAMGECGTDVRPVGTPVTERVVAAACELWDPATGSPQGSVLVVSAPPSVAAVRTYDGDGGYLGNHPVRDGMLVVPMPVGTTEVEAVTADGVLLGRTGLLPTGVWLGE